MIATLTGTVSEKVGDIAVVDCGGVGYGVLMSHEDFGAINSGQSVKLHIYEHIREASHDLFGFRSLLTKKMFELLLGVNGVGPKMALSILSVASLDQVKQAIAAGDTKFIAQATGVGKRVAERVVVDLKDKVGFDSDPNATSFLGDTLLGSSDEALQGLVSLGYSASDATAVLAKIDSKLPPEERIKLALKNRF